MRCTCACTLDMAGCALLTPATPWIRAITSLVIFGSTDRQPKFSVSCAAEVAPRMTVDTSLFFKHQARDS